MPFIPLPGTVQLEILFTWDGQYCETVLHYTKEAGFDNDDMVDLAEYITAWIGSDWDTLMSNTITFIGLRLTDMTSETGTVIDYGTGFPIQGFVVSPSLPNNVALVVTKRTLLRGRSYRGRVFVPGLSEGNVTGNVVNPAHVAAVIAALEDIRIVPVTSGQFEMSVASRYADKQPRAVGVVTGVSAFTSDGVVDSMRRRLPGRGA